VQSIEAMLVQDPGSLIEAPGVLFPGADRVGLVETHASEDLV
jgi:hypothetical protein